jgi:hypothetical protein
VVAKNVRWLLQFWPVDLKEFATCNALPALSTINQVVKKSAASLCPTIV